MPVPQDFPLPHDRDTAIFTELYQIMKILSLSQGNIGAKGNIHFLWQKSKLNLILPNLPKDCIWVVIKCQQGYGTMTTMKLTKFIKIMIERVLCLLDQTCEPWTSIQIIQENLSACPFDGDLTDLNEDFHETIEDEIIEDTANPTTNDHPVLDTNGDVSGPAELQNPVKEIETLEGLVNLSDGNNMQGEIAQHAVYEVEDAVARLGSPHAALPTPPDHNPPTTATYH